MVAAGNGNAQGVHQDACSVSPARVAEAVTVGAALTGRATGGVVHDRNGSPDKLLHVGR